MHSIFGFSATPVAFLRALRDSSFSSFPSQNDRSKRKLVDLPSRAQSTGNEKC